MVLRNCSTVSKNRGDLSSLIFKCHIVFIAHHLKLAPPNKGRGRVLFDLHKDVPDHQLKALKIRLKAVQNWKIRMYAMKHLFVAIHPCNIYIYGHIRTVTNL